MEGFRPWHWFSYSVGSILFPLLMALSSWFSRGEISRRAGLWYLYAIIDICRIVLNAWWEPLVTSVTPHAPLLVRALHPLSLALLVIAVLAIWPRKSREAETKMRSKSVLRGTHDHL
jgi:hypothetical protein